MPRVARKISGSGMYHVVLRGINKQTVFYDGEDKEVLLNRLKLVKQELPYVARRFLTLFRVDQYN